MKKLITLMLALMPMIAMAQQKDNLDGSVWTDGCNIFTLKNVQGKANLINGTGGTLHEGGLMFALKGTGGNYKIVEGDNGEPVGSEYYYKGQNLVYNAGDPNAKLKTIQGKRYLLVYDGNELVNIFHFLGNVGLSGDLPSLYDLAAQQQNDVEFAGEYIDSKGDLVTFSTKEFSVSGLRGGKERFTVAEVYDMPSNIIQFSDGTAYSIDHEDDGLLLTKMNCIGDDAADWEPTKESIKLYHVLPTMMQGTAGKTSRFDFASRDVLFKSALGGFTKKELQLMRNEIYARHGYQFSTPEMKNYFEGCPWYRSRGNNNAAVAELSEVEQLNIQLIKRCEKEINND